MTATTDLDHLVHPDVVKDPHALYARLREADPVHWNPLAAMWVVTRYDDITAELQDPRFSSRWPAARTFARPLCGSEQESFAYLRDVFARMMIWHDGAEHARQRGLVHKAFTRPVIQRIRADIERIVGSLLDRIEEKGRFDGVGEFALQIPATVIFVLCGIPEAARPLLMDGTEVNVEFFGLFEPAPGQLESMAERLRAADEAVRRIIESRRASPGDDLISLLTAVREGEERLTDDDICSFVLLLVGAGYETTTNLIANGLLALLRNPAELALLKDRPDLIESAVEEFLRYDAPVLATFRATTEDVPLGGKVIPKGQMVMFALGAANRDAAHFAEPDRLDIARAPNRHVAFGFGAHYCLGAPLARMEAHIAFREILRRLRDLRLAGEELAWRPNMALRALASLPLASTPAASACAASARAA